MNKLGLVRQSLFARTPLITRLVRPTPSKCQPTSFTRRSFTFTNKNSNIGNNTKSSSSNGSSNNNNSKRASIDNASGAMYSVAAFIFMLGASYAAVPLYRLFCANTGFSGTPVTDVTRFSPDRLVPLDERKRIRITFESNMSDTLAWSFKPELREVYVVPGETALTFYRAKSYAKEDVVGIATYNVTPHRAGSYFNKIQCFCFEEQKLSPGEDVDMPVFFFIDPDFLEDPYMKDVNTITLGYTFFDARYAKNLQPQNS